MVWSGESGTRLVQEFLVGAVTAIVALGLFLPISIEWKVVGIAVLSGEGAILILLHLGKGRNLMWKLRQSARQREIRKHPDVVADLYRLERRIYAVLYERSSSQPSLRLQGEEAMAALASSSDGLGQEFMEKMNILNGAFTNLHHRVEGRRNAGLKGWRTLEFVEVLRDISAHLNLVDQVVPTAYRLAAIVSKKGKIPAKAWNAWESFRAEYNAVLQEWKSFTQRFDQLVGYGTSTNANLIKGLRDEV